MPTPTLNLPLIADGQAQPHVTHNEAVDMLDALFPRIAQSATLTVPPGSPADGSAYILPAGASGFGSAAPGDIALWHGGLWRQITPAPGWRWFVADEGGARVFDGTAWKRGDVVGALGSVLGFATLEVELDLTGASVTAAGLIPARAIVLGVTSWTVNTVTGATSYSVGDGGDPSRFGGSLGAAPGSSNVGVVGPFATYAPTDVIVTASGGAFTGGKVGLAAAVILPGAPS